MGVIWRNFGITAPLPTHNIHHGLQQLIKPNSVVNQQHNEQNKLDGGLNTNAENFAKLVSPLPRVEPRQTGDLEFHLCAA